MIEYSTLPARALRLPFWIACAFTAACGGGGSGGGAAPPPGPPPVPPPLIQTLTSDSGRTSLQYVSLSNVIANDLVWDAQNGLIHVVTAANSPSNPSSIMSLNPSTGVVQATATLPGQASAIAVSADGQYVYAGIGLAAGIRRFRAANLAADITIPVGLGNSRILQVAVSPLDAGTIAVVADNLELPERDAGVAVYDGAARRPDILYHLLDLPDGSWFVTVYSIAWAPDGSTIYVSGNSPRGIVDLSVGPQGVAFQEWRHWPAVGRIRAHGSKLYASSGNVLDMAAGLQLGRFGDYGNTGEARTEIPANDKAFSAVDHRSGAGVVDGLTVLAFDVRTFGFVDSITWNGVTAGAQNGRLYAWGSDGFAWADGARVIIAKGSFSGSGGSAPDPVSPPLLLNRTVTSSAGDVDVRILDFGSSDVVADACGHLFVSVSGWSAFRPNTVSEFDVSTMAVTRSVHAGSEPHTLAVSDDCSTLYAGLWYSNAISRIRTADFVNEATIPLRSTGGFPYGDIAFARSISVMPGQPQSFAVAKGSMEYYLCRGVDLGLSVFDGDVERPVKFGEPPNPYTVKSVAWGADGSTLYGEDPDGGWAFTVDQAGIQQRAALYPSRTDDTLIYNAGRDLYFDPLSARLYDFYAGVFDTQSGTDGGQIPTAWTPGILVNACGSPMQAITTDRVTGKVYFAYTLPGLNGIGVATYDMATLATVDSVEIPLAGDGEFGIPYRVAKAAADTLVVTTEFGYLFVLKGEMFRE